MQLCKYSYYFFLFWKNTALMTSFSTGMQKSVLYIFLSLWKSCRGLITGKVGQKLGVGFDLISTIQVVV